MDSVVVLVSVQTRVCPGFESVVTTECVAVRVWWLVLSGECMYSRDQPYPAVHLLVAFLTRASHESSRPPLGRALRVRARPTIPTAGPTRALAIAPLRAAPAGGGEVAGEGARAAGGGGARFPEQPAQKEERKKINPWVKLELLLPLPPPRPCGAPPRG